MQQPISITAISSISTLGNTIESTWVNYQKKDHFFEEKHGVYVSSLADHCKKHIEDLRNSEHSYKSLDDSVLFAIYAARKAIKQAGWSKHDNFGINIGSSRGATQLFETYHEDFLTRGKSETLSSPTTTLGNISSWLAHDLQTQGPEISHSITCSTALHAMLNGIAWINSGMSKKFLVGGSEAPLTPFTIAQMQALKIYANKNLINDNNRYPCRALDFNKTKNTMILGEGAAMACLEPGNKANALALVSGIGYATEVLEHNVSLSTDAKCFQRSMRMALGTFNPDEIDVIVTHTPGTVKGDLAELKAIKKVFGNNHPLLTNNKWKLGHTFGASGMLSVEMAILMLKHQEFIQSPFLNQSSPKQLNHIMVNAVGFGGNAVSILISRC
ncbi:beta-ketoacyl synthase N-terminal-like domain-containing protein [Geojedonia litorea]|uniref:Beta-ketoacyl synthase N-terminal-like domain-containing protein n=1 Tax=Geojedonia litorea TaxID=1268269 RepID=A0ABV9N428_9FLAO